MVMVLRLLDQQKNIVKVDGVQLKMLPVRSSVPQGILGSPLCCIC